MTLQQFSHQCFIAVTFGLSVPISLFHEIEIHYRILACHRSGSKSEALGGPLLYTIVLFLGTLLFFRDSPIGVVAISQMAAGDGIADIIGR